MLICDQQDARLVAAIRFRSTRLNALRLVALTGKLDSAMVTEMDIEFADNRLALIETERAADTKLPVAVIQSARQRLSIIRAAPDVRTMQNWKSLGLQARATDVAEHVVVLAPQWAMVLRIEEKNSAMTVVVRAMEEQVRGAA